MEPMIAGSPVVPEHQGSMSLKAAVAVIVVLIIIIGGYWYWQSGTSEAPAETAADLPSLDSAATTDITTDVTVENPTEGVVNLNPTEAANPFTEIETNPFSE